MKHLSKPCLELWTIFLVFDIFRNGKISWLKLKCLWHFFRYNCIKLFSWNQSNFPKKSNIDFDKRTKCIHTRIFGHLRGLSQSLKLLQILEFCQVAEISKQRSLPTNKNSLIKTRPTKKLCSDNYFLLVSGHINICGSIWPIVACRSSVWPPNHSLKVEQSQYFYLDNFKI